MATRLEDDMNEENNMFILKFNIETNAEFTFALPDELKMIDDWDESYAVLSSDFKKLLNKAIEYVGCLISSFETDSKRLEKSLVEEWNILLKKLSNYKNKGVDGYPIEVLISTFNGIAYWDNGYQHGSMEILEWAPPVELNVI